MQIQPHSFWDFNVGNLLTLAGVLGAWVTARYFDAKGHAEEYAVLKKRVELLETWQETHEKEASTRNKLIVELEKCTTRLTTLAEIAQSRITELDRRRNPGD